MELMCGMTGHSLSRRSVASIVAVVFLVGATILGASYTQKVTRADRTTTLGVRDGDGPVTFSNSMVFQPTSSATAASTAAATRTANGSTSASPPVSAARAWAAISDGPIPAGVMQQYGTITQQRNPSAAGNAGPAGYNYSNQAVWAFIRDNVCLPESTPLGNLTQPLNTNCTIYAFVDATTGKALWETEVKH